MRLTVLTRVFMSPPLSGGSSGCAVAGRADRETAWSLHVNWSQSLILPSALRVRCECTARALPVRFEVVQAPLHSVVGQAVGPTHRDAMGQERNGGNRFARQRVPVALDSPAVTSRQGRLRAHRLKDYVGVGCDETRPDGLRVTDLGFP